MKILLDTHVLLWWLSDAPRLPPAAREKLADRKNEIHVSIVSLWEIVIKLRVGKLEAELAAIMQDIEKSGLLELQIAEDHLRALAVLPIFHHDPFDHMLIAQAIAEGATLVSADAALTSYPVSLMQV